MQSSGRCVLLLGSYAPSLINFRGPLIRAMVELGHKVVAAAPDMDGETKVALAALGAEPRSIAIRNSSLNPFEDARSFCSVRGLIRSTKPDLLIAYTIKPIILGALAARAERVPRIVAIITGLGYAFTEGKGVARNFSRFVARRMYKLALVRADKVLFQNPDDEALFRDLRLTAPDQATAVVNGSGVDIDHYAAAPLPGACSFLMIGRLLGDKGVREYALAAARLKAKRPDVRCFLAGYRDGSPNSVSEAEVKEMMACGVEFLGRLDDVRPAIAGCSVYVLPSYREGTPRSVLEAMAMARPIITTDAPGCRETVVPGLNGLLVQARDADALGDAMLSLVDEPGLRTAMGKASRQIAEMRYDARKVSSAILTHAGLQDPS